MGLSKKSFVVGKQRKRSSSSSIKSLSRDLLVDILARVASSSSTDLFNAKLCCKDFFKAGEDECVFERVSMDKFGVIYWHPPSDGLRSFLTSCLDKGNPEALFRQGLKEYFNEVKVESGMDYLKRASEKGHTAATYVYCMILLSRGDESQALNLLNSIKSSRRPSSSNWGADHSSNYTHKYQSILSQMWINNSISRQQAVNVDCQKRYHSHLHCDTCMWYREFTAFRKDINRSVFIS